MVYRQVAKMKEGGRTTGAVDMEIDDRQKRSREEKEGGKQKEEESRAARRKVWGHESTKR